MKKNAILKFLIALPLLAVTGCTATAQSAHYAPTAPMMAMEAPAQQAQVQSPFDGNGNVISAMQQQQVQAVSQISSLSERVRRVERAMIRLDRRMQILERNELARMTSAQGGADLGTFQQTAFTPSGNTAAQHYGTMTSPFARGAATMSRGMAPQQQATVITPVSADPSMITSSLQPKTMAVMPSIADKPEDNKFVTNDTNMAVWTVQYERSKVWPAREQLTGAREVVDALRSDKPVALFARGADPSSREFRERIRALGRYLGRVASVENVPIASLPAKHLDSDTIEIMVAQ